MGLKGSLRFHNANELPGDVNVNAAGPATTCEEQGSVIPTQEMSWLHAVCYYLLGKSAPVGRVLMDLSWVSGEQMEGQNAHASSRKYVRRDVNQPFR